MLYESDFDACHSVINGERATIKESPNFKHKLMATRKSLLGEIVKTFSKPRRGSGKLDS